MANEQNILPYKWQPGHSGNPAGLPKGTRHLSTVIQEFMDDEKFELKLKNGEILKGTPSKNIVKVMYSLAVSGNVKAAEWLAKHGYGQKLTLEIEDKRLEVLAKYGMGVANARKVTEAQSRSLIDSA